MEETIVPARPNPMRAVFGARDFMLLWTGQTTSMLGDQFHGIAGAWVVLKLTGDPLMLGTVMALGGIPRALFTLVGGALTDRFSPRKVMLASDAIRLLIAALMAIQLLTNTLQVWMLFAYTLVGGIVGGFFGPAAMSILPRLLPEKDLQAGNSLSQGSSQLIGFIGPAIAGGVIALFPNQTMGAGVVIGFDALTFIVSIITLWLMKAGGEATPSAVQVNLKSVVGSIREGFGYMLKDPALRLMFFIIAIANMSFGGPIVVGVPFLANSRFPEGAAAYGVIISGYAGGNLLGILVSGALPRPGRRVIQGLMVTMFAVFGIGVAALGWISLTWLAALDLFVMGVLNGYLSIQLITALQRTTPKEMLGRTMSMILFANMVFMPISQAITGGVLRWSVALPFVGAGLLLLGLGVYLLTPTARDSLVGKLIEG